MSDAERSQAGQAILKLFEPIGRLLRPVKPGLPIPPASLVFVGAGDFVQVGLRIRHWLVQLGGLRPDDHVLDVGSGAGRAAIPLTEYLSARGEYWGFEIVKEGVDWCCENITPRYGNFHFLHADVHNKAYNPGGQIQARDIRLPFEDESLDFVFLTSVFTHMLALDVEHYMQEIHRILKPGGRTLITYFLLNDETLGLISKGATSLDFKHEIEQGLTLRPEDPEYALAYKQEYITDLYRRNGLSIVQPIVRGQWCWSPERKSSLDPDFETYQDIVVAVRD